MVYGRDVFALVAFVLVAAEAQRIQEIRGRTNTPKKASCVFDNEGVKGVIEFTQDGPRAPTIVRGQLRNLTAGPHGFHVHEYGDLSNGCTSAGAHFNPFAKDHGGPQDDIRHVGDLGNIVANASGIAVVDIQDEQIRLCGPLSIVGRAMMVHAFVDDLGRGSDAESKKTGNAGARVGCCVIGIAPTKP